MKPTSEQKSSPETFAIIRDGRRRGGWRVTRVRVLLALDLMQAANVQELDWPREHWLPFAQLAKFPRAAGRKLRALLAPKFPAAPEEEQSAVVEPLAGPAGAAEETQPWYRRESEFAHENQN